jgi:hypothetical protein
MLIRLFQLTATGCGWRTTSANVLIPQYLCTLHSRLHFTGLIYQQTSRKAKDEVGVFYLPLPFPVHGLDASHSERFL